MAKILILSQWVDYLSTSRYHYSISKGFNIAAGFTGLGEIQTYYMTLGSSQEYELPHKNGIEKRIIHLINTNEITAEFLNKIDYILFIKEVEMFGVLENMPNLRELLLRTKRNQKIGVKSDSLGWIRSENEMCKKIFGFGCIELAANYFDLLYVQTPEFKTVDYARFCNNNLRIQEKIVISPMGVNNYVEEIDRSEASNPYDRDHLYCVREYDPKAHGHQMLGLYPIPIMQLLELPEDDPTRIAGLADFNRKKTILIYSGRLKMDGAIDMLKQIMRELGTNYELHIFPGSFNLPEKYRKPGEENVRYSGKHHFPLLRERIFNDETNVIVHHPFSEEEKGIFLSFADIGLDFSQTRPRNLKSCQGNCKLLEYCYYGLKVVAEKNINNSYLVDNGKNGILLPGIGTVQDYVRAIKEIEMKEIDREFVILETIRTNNWDIIAKDVIKDFAPGGS